jgi:hypothetical protein
MAAAAGMAAARKSRGMFTAPVMARIAYMAMPVLRLVSMEMVERLLAVCRKWSVVAMTRIVAVVDMAIKPARTVEPGACPEEHPTNKPIRPIVTIG